MAEKGIPRARAAKGEKSSVDVFLELPSDLP